MIVSGPASFLASLGLLLLPMALLPFAVPLLVPLRGAAARPEPAMPLAEGAALLFLPMLHLLHLLQGSWCRQYKGYRCAQGVRPASPCQKIFCFRLQCFNLVI